MLAIISNIDLHSLWSDSQQCEAKCPGHPLWPCYWSASYFGFSTFCCGFWCLLRKKSFGNSLPMSINLTGIFQWNCQNRGIYIHKVSLGAIFRSKTGTGEGHCPAPRWHLASSRKPASTLRFFQKTSSWRIDGIYPHSPSGFYRSPLLQNSCKWDIPVNHIKWQRLHIRHTQCTKLWWVRYQGSPNYDLWAKSGPCRLLS